MAPAARSLAANTVWGNRCGGMGSALEFTTGVNHSDQTKVAPTNAKRWARGADVKTAQRRAKLAESW